MRDLNPRGPSDHRLSRPAPYQARATPQMDITTFGFKNLMVDLHLSVFVFCGSIFVKLQVSPWDPRAQNSGQLWLKRVRWIRHSSDCYYTV